MNIHFFECHHASKSSTMISATTMGKEPYCRIAVNLNRSRGRIGGVMNVQVTVSLDHRQVACEVSRNGS
jgi:hypothetical protein